MEVPVEVPGTVLGCSGPIVDCILEVRLVLGLVRIPKEDIVLLVADRLVLELAVVLFLWSSDYQNVPGSGLHMGR